MGIPEKMKDKVRKYCLLQLRLSVYPKQKRKAQEKHQGPGSRLPLVKRKPNGSLDVTPKSLPPTAFLVSIVVFHVFTFQIIVGNDVFDPDKSKKETKSTEAGADYENVDTAKLVGDDAAK